MKIVLLLFTVVDGFRIYVLSSSILADFDYFSTSFQIYFEQFGNFAFDFNIESVDTIPSFSNQLPRKVKEKI